MDDATDKRWREVSEEILNGMKEWRLAHPKATFREIEQAASERVSRLEAQLVQDSAMASPQRDWKESSDEERPQCPVCETALQKRGKQQRKLQGKGGQEISLTRSYGTCPVCGTGLFPPG